MKRNEYATPFDMLHAARLLSQKQRIAKFDRAIKSVVTPDSYVVDLGTGSGVLALLAARAGAKHVSAVDINLECIDYAKRAAASNGLADRIDFAVAHYADYIPEEQADVVICEMLSSVMLVEQQVHACAHAVNHILKSDGVILPASATLYVVPVESEVLSTRFVIEDIDFPPVPQTARPDDSRDLANTATLGKIDFTAGDFSDIDSLVQFEIVDDGTIHGFLGLFEAHLHGEISLNMEDGWKPLFLPVKDDVFVTKGETLDVRIRFTPGKYDTLDIAIE
ncbi:MAG: 50S ribosomal protein L11 methyltransferase [Candidatus Thorarchaeota archaeon]